MGKDNARSQKMINKMPNPFKTSLFSAWGLIYRAAIIILVFSILHLAGFRQYTSFITGTTSGNYLDILGMAYFVFYSLSIFVVPIFLIASCFLALSNKAFSLEKSNV
jgi:hypothetical protein